MFNKKMLLLLFILIAIIQITVSASMIINREIILKSGKLYKFRTAPVDPYDAFRGRYVALSLDSRIVPFDDGEDYARRQTVFALITEDERGFARIERVQKERPDHERYIKAKIGYIDKVKNTISLILPFNRFYMDEFEAPRAEEAHRKSSSKEDSETYITVRVKSGQGVIEGLYIDDKHIREYLREENK